MIAKWAHKYERKPGRWIFEPTDEYRVLGKAIKKAVCSVWKPPQYYFHLRRGGHVRALQRHTKNTFFVRFDIEYFFGRVIQNRVTRLLKEYFPYDAAKKMAFDSTVHQLPGRFAIPYGFVQSPILASLALAKSRLGGALDVLHRTKGLTVSVYVDDIIVSGNDAAQLEGVCATLVEAAKGARLDFNAAKSQGPAKSITAFNVELTNDSLAIVAERLAEFADILETARDRQRDGILGYVKSINADQEKALVPIHPPISLPVS